MIFNKMDIRSHFEFRIKVFNDNHDMIVCMSNGTYLLKNRSDSLITETDSTVFAERFSLDEKTGTTVRILPMYLDEARAYVKVFNKTRKKQGWKPLEFDILAKNAKDA